jgi:hypothetical protein
MTGRPTPERLADIRMFATDGRYPSAVDDLLMELDAVTAERDAGSAEVVRLRRFMGRELSAMAGRDLTKEYSVIRTISRICDRISARNDMTSEDAADLAAIITSCESGRPQCGQPSPYPLVDDDLP